MEPWVLWNIIEGQLKDLNFSLPSVESALNLKNSYKNPGV